MRNIKSFVCTKKKEVLNLKRLISLSLQYPRVGYHVLSIQLHCSFRRLRDLGIARNSFAMTMNIPPSPLPFLFAIPKILNTVSHAHHVASQQPTGAGQSSNSSFIGLHRRDLMPARVFRAHPCPLVPFAPVSSLLFDDIKIVFYNRG